jgi:tRNA U38,U39,U40 pseudouridine synthase TruA
MIRRIVGAAVHVASNSDFQVNLIKQVLLAKNPQHALLNAPAEGLLLYRITYTNG